MCSSDLSSRTTFISGRVLVSTVARSSRGRGDAGLGDELGEAERGQRCLLGGLGHDAVAGGEGGPGFHAAISSGKFQGMIWPTTPSGLGDGERLAVVRGFRPVVIMRLRNEGTHKGPRPAEPDEG